MDPLDAVRWALSQPPLPLRRVLQYGDDQQAQFAFEPDDGTVVPLGPSADLLSSRKVRAALLVRGFRIDFFAEKRWNDEIVCHLPTLTVEVATGGSEALETEEWLERFTHERVFEHKPCDSLGAVIVAAKGSSGVLRLDDGRVYVSVSKFGTFVRRGIGHGGIRDHELQTPPGEKPWLFAGRTRRPDSGTARGQARRDALPCLATGLETRRGVGVTSAELRLKARSLLPLRAHGAVCGRRWAHARCAYRVPTGPYARVCCARLAMNREGHPETLEPSHPENTNNLRHGAYIPRLREPRAQEIAEAIMAEAHAAPIDTLGAVEVGRLEALIESLDAEIERVGLGSKGPKVGTLLEMRLRATRRLSEWLGQYGMTPKGRAEWARQLAESETLAETIRRRREATGR